MADGSRYVRDAGATLGRIVAERRIRGSVWRIPGKKSAVAFSALSPGEAVRLMRWRKRFARMSFEPYGIAIEKNVLAGMGAREVIYMKNGIILSDGDERIFTHSAGENGRWTDEREWRLPGDLDLKTIPADSVRIVVPDARAAEYFGDGGNGEFPVHVLFTD